MGQSTYPKEAHLTRPGVAAAALGDISVFSFYANKLVTTGEGGMVLTNDPNIAEHVRSLRNLCFQRQRRFYHTELGHNFRLTNLQAAIGLAQIERMPATIHKKRWIGETYTEPSEAHSIHPVTRGGELGKAGVLDVCSGAGREHRSRCS